LWPHNLINAISKQRSRSFILCVRSAIRHSQCKAAYQIWSLYSSSSFTDMFDRMSKIVGVTWPRPCPLSGKLFVRPFGIHHSPYKNAHQIWNL